MSGALDYAAATAVATLVRNGEVSAREVVAHSLARIEAVNADLNCFCFIYGDEALALADEADRRLAAGERCGPLHGVPIAIKDFTPLKGKRTTRGSRILEHWVADFDPVIVRRLRGAGAIVVGKTTTPEFAYAGFTASPLWGVTRNPWNPGHTPGGSSGGSAAAVAAGCVALAEGTDMGGSVRIPAACCGIVGLKPSLGRIPMDILPSVFDTMSHFGPLARTIDDAALFLDVTQGPDDRDPLSLQQRVTGLDRIPRAVAGLRLAFSPDLGHYAIDAEVDRLCRDACERLRAAGATVTEVELGWSREIGDAWMDLWRIYLAAWLHEHVDEWRPRMTRELVRLVDQGRRIGAVAAKRIEIVRSRQWHSLCALFDRYDALLCPTLARTAPPVDMSDSDFGEVDAAGRLVGYELTHLFNMVPHAPVLSVPAGLAADGLPVALQIVGRRFDEGTVLRVGAALEDAIDWPSWRPPGMARAVDRP